MIKNDHEFQQTLEQLERMYRALAALRKDVLPKNPRTFAVLAEGPLITSGSSSTNWSSIECRYWPSPNRQPLPPRRLKDASALPGPAPQV
jgi:hypothetical protein